MANVSIPILDAAGATRNIDGYTLPNGDVQQATVIGDGANDGRTMAVEADGSARVGTNLSSTATRTSVTSVITDTVILAANAGRRGFIIYNESTSVLKIGFGTTATTATSYSVLVAANSTYVGDIPLFTGQIRGQWVTTANGAARVTEFTA